MHFGLKYSILLKEAQSDYSALGTTSLCIPHQTTPAKEVKVPECDITSMGSLCFSALRLR